jgi:hypothetical protein
MKADTKGVFRVAFLLILLIPFGNVHLQTNSKNAIVNLNVVKPDKSPIEKVLIEITSSSKKRYAIYTDTKGNAEINLPCNDSYRLYVNEEFIDNFTLLDKKYKSIRKKITYDNEILKYNEKLISDNNNSLIQDIIPTIIVDILIENLNRQPLIGEEFTLKPKSGGDILKGKTNASGIASINIQKGTFYKLSFKRNPEFTSVFVNKNEKLDRKKMMISYLGTVFLEEEEEKRKRKIKVLEEERLKINDEIKLDKAKKNEKFSLYNKLRNSNINEYTILSNYEIDLNHYLSLEKALSQNKIKISCSGSANSTHYLKPLEVNIQNITNTSIQVMIEAGRTFFSEKNCTQNLIVTQKKLLLIRPMESEKIDLNAMCIQSSKPSPRADVKYTLGPIANENMITLARFIEKNNYHNPLGQEAIWVLSDHKQIDLISGINEHSQNKLKEFVKTLTWYGINEISKEELKLKKIENNLYELNQDIYKTVDPSLINYNQETFKQKTQGSFDFEFTESSETMIAMFNKEGILVRELFYDEKSKIGNVNMKFAFDSSVYTDPEYYYKLIVNGEVVRTMKL